MLTFGTTGTKKMSRFLLKETKAQIKQQGGIYTGTTLGKKWEESRFKSPYFRHGLWDLGYVVDTFETAADWNKVPNLAAQMEEAISKAAGDTPVHVFTHLSHVYPQGSSIYTTYVFPCVHSYEQTLAAWRRFKKAASDAVVQGGGTISHQHGVGRDHAPWLLEEKGPLAIATLKHLSQHFDPKQHLNVGCLVEEEP